MEKKIRSIARKAAQGISASKMISSSHKYKDEREEFLMPQYFCEKCGSTENVGFSILTGSYACALCASCVRKWNTYAADLPETLKLIELLSLLKIWENYKIEENADIITKIHYIHLELIEIQKKICTMADNWMKGENQ